MTIYFSADLHLSHHNIISYADRPFKTALEMNNILIDNFNACVRQNDDVYILGDFSFSRDIEEIKDQINMLNGFKYLVLGNHDREIAKHISEFTKPGLFVKVVDNYVVKHNHEKIFCSHYSHRVWNGSHHSVQHCFGHSHGSLPPFGKSVDVGIDSPWVTGKKEYRPFSVDEITLFMQKQEIAKIDNHA
jgi:calcineurin-like phosphoesterase family protein